MGAGWRSGTRESAHAAVTAQPRGGHELARTSFQEPERRRDASGERARAGTTTCRRRDGHYRNTRGRTGLEGTAAHGDEHGDAAYRTRARPDHAKNRRTRAHSVGEPELDDGAQHQPGMELP